MRLGHPLPGRQQVRIARDAIRCPALLDAPLREVERSSQTCAQKQGWQVAHGGPCDVTGIGVCSVDRVGCDVRLRNQTTAADLARGIDPNSNIALINIGTATRNDLKIIPGLSPRAITITTEEKYRGNFSSIGNFGKTRVLGLASICRRSKQK